MPPELIYRYRGYAVENTTGIDHALALGFKPEE